MRHERRKGGDSLHPSDGLPGVQESVYLPQPFQARFSPVDTVVV